MTKVIVGTHCCAAVTLDGITDLRDMEPRTPLECQCTPKSALTNIVRSTFV
jgi:hypothetical protein